MMKTAVALFSTIFASACCSSLPKMAAKKVQQLPAATEAGAVSESSELWRDETRSRDLPVHIYKPAASGRRPVVIFSHGIGEDRDSYSYVGRALAANGFVAVHLTHAGTDKATLKRGYWKLYQATKDPEVWRNRVIDVRFAIDEIVKRPDVDAGRVAVVGHSAGAFAAFIVAGARGPQGESARDDRVSVIVPMSMPRIDGITYDDIRIPVLNMTGTCDSSIIYRTRQHHRRVPFEATHAPHQYLATIVDVNHNTFSNARDPHHALIMNLTIAFLRAWLLDDLTARAFFDDAGTVTLGREQLTVERK